MLRRGILNPAINSLLARVRHTNTLVIADRGFPYWPSVETIDISLVDDIPKVLDVLRAVRENFFFGRAFMAEEFRAVNTQETVALYEDLLKPAELVLEPHVQFKKRVPSATGIIRTADTVQYANVILESA
ncbi:MAG: RbsD/FucU domain-containing protein [bacterium]|jgi:D-ribose pyranase